MRSYREIALTRGFFARVSPHRYDTLAQFTWSSDIRVQSDGTEKVYAICALPRHNGRMRKAYMHRMIAQEPPATVDHRDGDGLNNTDGNLLVVRNGALNQHNRLHLNRYRGVYLHRGRYRAQISIGNRDYHLGMFDTQIDAAKAYDARAREVYGPFAMLNFPLDESPALLPVAVEDEDIPFAP
jgi:hypothetical protein